MHNSKFWKIIRQAPTFKIRADPQIIFMELGHVNRTRVVGRVDYSMLIKLLTLMTLFDNSCIVALSEHDEPINPCEACLLSEVTLFAGNWPKFLGFSTFIFWPAHFNNYTILLIRCNFHIVQACILSVFPIID